MQPKYILIILTLIITVRVHFGKIKKAGSIACYLKELLGFLPRKQGASPSSDRIKSFDYLRALAVLSVIGTHVVQSGNPFAEYSAPWLAQRFLAILFLNCNVLFIMLSGALLLSRKEEPIALFYRKRVFRVVIPMAVYYLFYLYTGLYQSGLMDPANLLDAARRFLTGPSDWNPHFWLIYIVIALYLTTPFFKVMVQNMSDRLLLSFVFLTVLMNGALSWFPLFGVGFNFSTILCGWESVFIFGYFWTRPCSIRFRKPCFLLGTAAFVMTFAISCTAPNSVEAFFNRAPTMLFMSGAIFSWFISREERLKTPGPLIQIIGKYGFSILLIHWYVLHQVVEAQLGLTLADYGFAAGTLLAALATLVLSWLFAVVFDNTAVLVAETICDRVLWGIEMIINGRKK